MKKIMKRFFVGCFVLLFLFVFSVFGVNFYVIFSTSKQIVSESNIKNMKDIDAIVVLGCQVRNNNTPSKMLQDRLKTGISLFNKQVSDHLLMSGDNESKYYNEVRVMKDYAMNEGILESDILEDPLGLSTYESMYRIKNEFHFDKVIIVTQKYHLYRALYIAKSFGIEAIGVPSEGDDYSGQMNRELREILARNKDFVYSITKPIPGESNYKLD